MRRQGRALWVASSVALSVAGGPAASAQTPSGDLPGAPAENTAGAPGQSGTGTPTASRPATGFWQRANLLGEVAGLRPALATYGVTFGASETNEVLGNVTAGLHRGADDEGLTLLGIGIDTGSAFGWAGGTFNVSALQIHGRNLSRDNLDTLQIASGIEADRASRLWELWYEQRFLGGRIDVKLGQQSIDQEFLISQGSSLFIDAAMGWPVVPSADLYAGGPAYPLSSLGVRVRAQPAANMTVLAAVFDDDSQLRGGAQSGPAFDPGTGARLIVECQYALNPPPSGAMPRRAPPPRLPGVYKLGFYYDTGRFPDQRVDSRGLPLAALGSDGTPALRAHDWSVYAVADQTLWWLNPGEARAVGVFARMEGAPGRANLLSFGLNAGLTLKAPWPGRDNDTLGIGYGLARISGAASGFDQDAIRFSGSPMPVRSSESLIELTYQAQIAPWWIVQPDAQYVLMPGGGVANPLAPGQRVDNELVLGLRTNVTF